MCALVSLSFHPVSVLMPGLLPTGLVQAVHLFPLSPTPSDLLETAHGNAGAFGRRFVQKIKITMFHISSGRGFNSIKDHATKLALWQKLYSVKTAKERFSI